MNKSIRSMGQLGLYFLNSKFYRYTMCCNDHKLPIKLKYMPLCAPSTSHWGIAESICKDCTPAMCHPHLPQRKREKELVLKMQTR